MADLADLIVPETVDELDERMTVLAAASDMPVTSWGPDGVPRTILGIVAEVAADCWFSVAAIANGLQRRYAKRGWLTLLASSQYDEERKLPTITAGKIILTDNGGGPHTIAAGALIVSTAGGVRFRNTSGGTLTLGGTLELDVAAEAAGAASNVAIGAINTMVTTLASVTVSNPEIGTTDTWITSLGTNYESDLELSARLPLKWATLSTGSPEAAYRSWALAVDGITRAAVDALNPDGASTLRVYIDNAALVASFQSVVDTKKPAGARVTVVAASSVAVAIEGVVTVQKAFRAAAEVAVAAALVELQNEIDISGTVRQSEVIERVMSPDGVVDFAIASSWTGTPNIVLSTGQIPSFVVSLTWLEV